MTDVFATATADIFAAMLAAGGAVEAEYSRDNKTVTIIVDHDLTRWGDAVQVSNDSVLVGVMRDAISEKPWRNDTFTAAGGAVYRVDKVLFADEQVYRCVAVEVAP